MSQDKLDLLTEQQLARYYEYLALEFLPKSAYMMAKLDYEIVRYVF